MPIITIKLHLEPTETVEDITKVLDKSKIISVQTNHTPISATEYAKRKAANKHYLYKEWLSIFKPTLSNYSNRSILLRHSIQFDKLLKKWEIIQLPSGKNLYYNNSLKGWITSVDNKNFLNKLLKCTDTIENTSFDDSLSEWSGDEEADEILSNYTYSHYKKGLLLISKDNQIEPNKKYFHNGYWNKTLQGWVFSKKYEESLKQKGATFIN